MLPKLRFTAPVRLAAAADGKPRRLTILGYTGGPMSVTNHGTIVIDLAGMELTETVPVLADHENRLAAVIGTGRPNTDGKELRVDATLAETAAAETVLRLLESGVELQASMGTDPLEKRPVQIGETVNVNGQDRTGPFTIVTRSRLKEMTITPLGADDQTSVSLAAKAAQRGSLMYKSMLATLKTSGNIKAAKYSDDDVAKMSEDEAKAALSKCMADDEETEAKARAKAAADEEEKAKAKAKAAEDDEKRAEASAADRIKARRKAEADEDRRCDAIRATVRKHGVIAAEFNGKKYDNFVAGAIEDGLDPRDVELVCLRAARPAAGVGGPHLHFSSAPVVNEAVIECAVFDALPDFRLFDSDFYKIGDHGKRRVPEREEKRITAQLNSRYTDQVRQAAHTHFRGRIGLQQMLVTLAAANGYRGPATFNDPDGWSGVAAYLGGMGGMIRADGPSTINTPATLANVQNKFVLQGYLFTEQAFMEFCNVLPVKDLKPTKSVQLFGDFVFKELSTNGEIQHATIGDNPYANQAKLQSRMINIPLDYLINDDLGIFGQVPMMLGRGWGLRVNELVYTPLNNPGLDDGGSTNFFAGTHTITGQKASSNLSSGAGSAMSSAGLQAAKILFDKQVDPAGKPLGVDAEILLYPPELDTPAIELMNSQFLVMAGLASTSAASKQPNTNIWKGRYKPVMSRYLSDTNFTGSSTTAHYLFANPSVIPVVQIAALNGQMTPTVQQAGQDWQFNMLGITMRGWGGVGVSMQNFRGAVKSAGV